jgi:uncharacterized RDD family membrane protein YckC
LTGGLTIAAVNQTYRPLDVRVTGRRVVATWIDLFLVGVVYRTLAALLHVPMRVGAGAGTHEDFASRVAHTWPGWLIYAVFIGVYYIVFESLWGRTIGKRLTGIRVVTDTGERADFGRVLLRTAFRLLDGIGGYVVAFLLVVLSSRRQRLGDLVANTLVVRA